MKVEDRYALASDERTEPNTLSKLVNDRSDYVRGALAANPATPAEALIRLAARAETYTDAQLVRNPKLPAEAMIEIAKRRLLAQDPRSNGRRLIVLLHPLVRRETVPVELLETLAESQAPVVLEEVAKHPATPPEILTRLADPDGNPLAVWMAAVANPSLPQPELELLYERAASWTAETMEAALRRRSVEDAVSARAEKP